MNEFGEQIAKLLPAMVYVRRHSVAWCHGAALLSTDYFARNATFHRAEFRTVVDALDRNAILIELNPGYIEMQQERATIERILKERNRKR